MVDSNRERAQLFLITALLIATFILSAVALLNLLHESPEFNTQQDSLSMSDTERVSVQLEADLHQYFLAHTSEKLVGYADKSDFQPEVDELGSRYTHLVGQSQSAHLGVTYNEAKSREGAIVYGNESTIPDDEQLVFEEIDSLTRFSVIVEEPENQVDLTIDIDNESHIFEITDNEIAWNDTSVEWNDSLEIDITYQQGEIRTDEDYLPNITLDTADAFNVSIDIETWDSGQFYLSTEDMGATTDVEDEFYTAGFSPGESVIVNPAFDIQYTNPDVRFNNTVQLFKEGEQ